MRLDTAVIFLVTFLLTFISYGMMFYALGAKDYTDFLLWIVTFLASAGLCYVTGKETKKKGN